MELEPDNRWRHGFILPIVEVIVCVLNLLNPAEWAKALAAFFYRLFLTRSEGQFVWMGFTIDVYITIKWAVLMACWGLGISGGFGLVLVWYLVAFNLFTYFYHHLWKTAYQPSVDNRKRRFINLVQAMLFGVVTYAYFYLIPYRHDFQWAVANPDVLAALRLSILTALGSTSSVAKPITDTAEILILTQLLGTFAYGTVLISASLPDVLGERNGVQK